MTSTQRAVQRAAHIVREYKKYTLIKYIMRIAIYGTSSYPFGTCIVLSDHYLFIGRYSLAICKKIYNKKNVNITSIKLPKEFNTLSYDSLDIDLGKHKHVIQHVRPIDEYDIRVVGSHVYYIYHDINNGMSQSMEYNIINSNNDKELLRALFDSNYVYIRNMYIYTDIRIYIKVWNEYKTHRIGAIAEIVEIYLYKDITAIVLEYARTFDIDEYLAFEKETKNTDQLPLPPLSPRVKTPKRDTFIKNLGYICTIASMIPFIIILYARVVWKYSVSYIKNKLHCDMVSLSCMSSAILKVKHVLTKGKTYLMNTFRR